METLFKPGDQVVLRTDLSAGMFYPMLEKKEVDGETYYLPSSDLVTAKAASWEMIDWINKIPFKTEFKTVTIESIKNGVYRLECCRLYCEWTDSMFDIIESKKLQEENRKRRELDSRFEVGDVVYLDVSKCEADQLEHFTAADVYGRYFGKYYVVSKKYDKTSCTTYQLKNIVYNNDGPVVEGRYLLKADEFTSKTLTRKQITITYNEKTRETIARLYIGSKIALSAHARRHKDDKNKYLEGAQRAFKRLLKKMEEKGYNYDFD